MEMYCLVFIYVIAVTNRFVKRNVSIDSLIIK